MGRISHTNLKTRIMVISKITTSKNHIELDLLRVIYSCTGPRSDLRPSRDPEKILV
jgi:hypothetical protein